MQVKEYKATIGSKTIYYEVAGAGEPMILLHGLSGSTRWWAKNVEFLAQSYQVHLVDMVGFGRGRGQRFLLKEAADLIAEWIAALRIPPAHVMGHSMGGYITLELAARHPSLVDHLVLVDALALPIGRSLWRQSLALAQALRYMPFDFLPVLFRDSLRAGPYTLVRAIREVLNADLTQDLERVLAPALIVWGEKDRVLPLQLGVDLFRALPGAVLDIISGAGHNPMWDRPEQFNRAVAQFLCARAEAVNYVECFDYYAARRFARATR